MSDKKQHPPDKPEDRFNWNPDDVKFYDKDGNRIYPKKKVEAEPPKPKVEPPNEN